MRKFGKFKKMGRFGRLPVEFGENVKVDISGSEILISGPRGSIARTIPNGVDVNIIDNNSIVVEKRKKGKFFDALQGTVKAHIRNMVYGVTEGWKRSLEVVGAGYRVELRGKTLVLTVGYSHPVEFEVPDGIQVTIEKSIINLEGIDKDLVGGFAAKIRAARKPEPYKGTGIRYIGEVVRRKPGKQAAKAGAG